MLVIVVFSFYFVLVLGKLVGIRVFWELEVRDEIGRDCGWIIGEE